MCGPTKPIKLIGPTKLTAVAVTIETNMRTLRRKKSTFTPKLLALLSPSFKAVSFQTSFKNRSKIVIKTMAIMPKLIHVVLDKLPNVQNNIAAVCSLDDKYCNMATND